MIIAENKELNLSVDPKSAGWDNLSPNEKWVIERFIEIRKTPSIVLIDTKPMDKMRLLRKVPTGFDLSGSRIHPDTGVKEKWVFCDRAVITNSGYKTYPAKHYEFFNRIELSTAKNVDLIFFLLDIVDVSQFGFVIEDKAADARRRIETNKLRAETENWIYSTCTDEDINNLAYRWQLTDIGLKDTSELRLDLFQFISANEAKKDGKQGYKAFIKEMTADSEIVKIGAYFNEAVKNNKIAFNPSNRTCYYSGTNELIMDAVIPPDWFKHNPNEYVIQWLFKNPKDKELFLASIKPADVREVIKTSGDWRLMVNYPQIRKFAKETYGIDLPQSGKVAEAKEIIRKFEEDMQEVTPGSE